MAENFFLILNMDCIYKSRPETFKEAKKRIDDFVHFYNHEMIRAKTGESFTCDSLLLLDNYSFLHGGFFLSTFSGA